jgi:thiosulfate dehydrogenase [quinone] large subunit
MVPAVGLLPVRFFFGATFLYAGIDKLLDAGFFDAASPGSIQAQMVAYARGSPIGELIQLAQPEAAGVGLLIAVAEIAIGLGALTGLAYRVAAVGGALLSALFFLTVSWSIHPYYLGSDLPYAVGWLSLAIAGHGNVLVPRRFFVGASRRMRRPDGRRRGPEVESPERRALLQTGLLALAAVALSSLAVPMRMLGLEHGTVPSRTPSSAPSSVPSTLPTSEPPPSGRAVARVADVDLRGAVDFTVPFDVPAPLPAGDPGVIVRLADGSYVAFDATCTHAGCRVGWSAADAALVCPCHDAAFDPAHGGAVLAGPAELPLTALPIVVDPSSGQILLRI